MCDWYEEDPCSCYIGNSCSRSCCRFVLYKPPNAALKIGYLPAASYGLVWIAYESGIFENEGLDVTLVEYPNVGQLASPSTQEP